VKILSAFLLAALAAASFALEPPAESAAPFLWEVQGPKAVHHLMGSVHVLPQRAHPLPAALEAAYASATLLVEETDLDALADPTLQARLLERGHEDRPGGLKAQIGAPLYAKLQKHAGALGMPLPVCEELRGWMCALMLELFPLQQAQFLAEFGLDQYFYARAREDGRTVAGLETAEEQTRLFTDLPDALSAQMMKQAVDHKAFAAQSPEELFRIWRTNDVATLEKLMKDMKLRYPQLYERLLSARNRAWTPKLAGYLAGEAPTLVIVGAGHLVGPDGLVAALRAKGFEVRPAPAVVEIAKPTEPAGT
jgi:uncharacterized protein YbaP (TraB family)